MKFHYIYLRNNVLEIFVFKTAVQLVPARFHDENEDNQGSTFQYEISS